MFENVDFEKKKSEDDRNHEKLPASKDVKEINQWNMVR